MKKNFKYDRVGESIKLALNNLIETKIEKLEFVSVLSVELTKDLGDAKVIVSDLSGNQKRVIDLLEKNNSLLKRELAKKVKMRRIPNLIFKYDSSLNHYNKIDEILENLKK